MWFEAILGLKINLNKSESFPMGRVDNVEDLSLELGCKVGSLPLTLGSHHISVATWEERFGRRLALWRRQYLSKGRRITLIRSPLFSMTIYLMSLVWMPRKV